ncbi:death-associated protein kinase 1-like [Anthonomus grandis grandis]|uniref:death-associated protein kinase 1-like n=1 Tax=Anthonomus grandis grandis TaxID=2921223 RepID=UPI0021668B8B|nr:death-associated protein kinase 1-like [Anthonomus grandis grandis]
MSSARKLSRELSYSPEGSFEYTALQFAVRRNSLEQVKYLIESGTELDTGPDPALHLALRNKQVDIAILLLEAGANFELRDSNGDQPIHISCALGLLEAVKVLCALGCNLETPTQQGLYPLHLAAKYGHIAVVRCLCAAGCNIEVRNFDNIRADITALKYGFNDIAELLDKLRVSGHRDHYARQLVPTSRPALKLSLRLLGHCGVGKTAFVKSLNAGLFGSLFRRSSSAHSNKSRPCSPISCTHIEMDVTSRQNSINFEPGVNYHSTSGIHVQNVDVSSVGDVTVWDFSGQETYFPVYHHFLWPTPYAVTAVLFRADDSPAVQIRQVCFWLNFLLARQKADLPTCEYGPVILVATHADQTRATKNHHGEWTCPDAQNTLKTVRKLMPHVPNLMDNVVVMDANIPASHAFKLFKSTLAGVKQNCLQKTVGTWTGLLENALSWLVGLRHDYDQFPVLNKSNFSDLLRTNVNLLASDEHIDELLDQLHVMGEVYCVQHLVVLSIPWLGHKLLGELLSTHFRAQAREIGVYTAEDFQSSYTQCDASGVLELLECLDLCVPCDVDGETEYEFPVYIQTETLAGLWDATDKRYSTVDAMYGGLRLYTSSGMVHLFKAIFPHIQVNLRRNLVTTGVYMENDSDLFQWSSGSKFCNMDMEGLITIEEEEQEEYVEVKVRGPPMSSQCCFHFLDNIMQTVWQAVNKVCPGLLVETHLLSPEELRLYSEDPYCYSSHLVTAAIMESESVPDVILFNPNLNCHETISQIIMFDDIDLSRHIQWGCVLGVQELPGPVKLRLCGHLDPPEPHGRDWCLLALRLGLCQKKIAALASQHTSHCMRLLTTAHCTIGALITSLHELDRDDAAELVLKCAPIFKVILEHASV